MNRTRMLLNACIATWTGSSVQYQARNRMSPSCLISCAKDKMVESFLGSCTVAHSHQYEHVARQDTVSVTENGVGYLHILLWDRMAMLAVGTCAVYFSPLSTFHFTVVNDK